MDRASRSELVKTIEGLKEQLQQYKSKLRDVVSAYKSLLKEKEALEASLSVLSTTSAQDEGGKAAPAADKQQHAEIVDTPERTPDPLGVNSSAKGDDSGQVSALKEQLKTLTVSLTTLSQEKTRIESQFVADNKQLRQENEQLQQMIEEERQKTTAQRAEFDQQAQELRSRIRTQQQEREKEQTDHALMLRELQKLLAQERAQREQLELQLDEARRSLQDQDSRTSVSEQYEKKIRDLSGELNAVRQRLQDAELRASQPSPFVLDLKREMSEMKASHQQTLMREQQKALEAESCLQQQSKQSEERISSLENKLSELSAEVGNYERLRFQDQQAIQKLKERVTQLDVENTALVRATKTLGGADLADEGNLDAQGLYERILQLKSQLIAANQRSERPVDMSGLFSDSRQVDLECSMCTHYKDELDQVKEEFERYKLRAQSVLKNKHKDNNMKEVDILKEQISELRDRLKTATAQHEEEAEQLRAKLDGMSRSMLAQADAHKEEIAHLKNSHQKEIFVLELETKKQRERTVALLAEKDQEIEQLRASVPHKIEQDYLLRMRDLKLEHIHDGDGLLRGDSESSDAVTQLLMHPASQQGEATLLHFAQEKARLDVEIVGLRKQKHQLEAALRELQHAMTLKEEKLQDFIQQLEEQIHKLERDKSREGANLEYLKNVLLKYLTTTDAHGHAQMLKAITTILQFSPAEKESVKASTHLKF